MSKHAYLIMAHNEPRLLKLLLHALDHPDNDIYLHIDKKVELLPDAEIMDAVVLATVKIYRQFSVAWGGDTQIKCELFLLQKAVETEHVYYHLLSGVDIPLLPQDAIHAFFSENRSCNYVSINRKASESLDFIHRIQYYRLFQNRIGRISSDSPISSRLMNKAESISLRIQKLFSINRIKTNPYSLYKGSNWFSITHDFAIYLLGKQHQIFKYFGYSIGADEVFLQSIIMSSEYAESAFLDNLRYVDWSESDLPGAPKTLGMQDYDSILNSGKLFARKFSTHKDEKVILRLYSRLE